MKVYHFIILFAIFAVMTVMITDMRISEKKHMDRERLELDEKLQMSVEAAAKELRASVKGFGPDVEQKAIDTFFYSMYAGLGIMDAPGSARMLVKYVPAFMITLKDGYYIYRYIGDPEVITPEDDEDMYGPNGKGYVRSDLLGYDAEAVETGGADIAFAAYLRDYPVGNGNYDGYGFSSVSVSDRTYYVVDADNIYHISGCPDTGDIKYIFFSAEGCLLTGAKACEHCIEGRMDQ